MLTRDQILTADDLPTAKVEVPEWKGEVFVRTLSAAERIVIAEWPDDISTGEFMTRYCALALSDEAGNRLFTDEDAEKLRARNPLALDRIMKACAAHNKMRKEDTEEAAKNSETGPTSDST